MLVEESLPANPTTCSRGIQQHLFSQLQSCNTLKKLFQIHAQIVINGFAQKNYILVKLLSFYVTSGNLTHAIRVFNNIENPSATVWNQMIRGHARSENPRKSVELYNRMVEAEAEPDGFTFSFLLSACARSGLLREGEQRMFDEMGERSVVSWNSLLVGYIRCGDVDGARRIFDEMPERNVVSWTTMIAWCAQNGMCCIGFSVSACAELGDLSLGRWIHWYIEKRMSVGNQPLLVSLNNALIHMYASCGVIDEAYKVFNKMPWKSTVSWTSIIMGFAKQGRGEEALSVFQSMVSSGVNQVRPDEITFIGVLCACSHAGFVDEGRHLFARMNQTWGISPKIEHYGCMVDLLSRAGFLDEAYRLVETMPIKPNDVVWGALLGGLQNSQNAELASHVAQNWVFELDLTKLWGICIRDSKQFKSTPIGEPITVGKRLDAFAADLSFQGHSWTHCELLKDRSKDILGPMGHIHTESKNQVNENLDGSPPPPRTLSPIPPRIPSQTKSTNGIPRGPDTTNPAS
uniref:Pentatricopeptide repeat-containing protein n=1 Tax=Fagus sylvatica TaxID=28930 RepID=A0A2N9HN17_FAGSY